MSGKQAKRERQRINRQAAQAARAQDRRAQPVSMKAILLKTIDTELARFKDTKAQVGMRTDDPEYNPELHEPVPCSYLAELRGIFRSPIGATNQFNPGVDPEDFDRAIEIVRALKKLKDGEWLRLTPDVYQYFEKRIKAVRWGMIEEWIVQFRSDCLHPSEVSDDEINKALDSTAKTGMQDSASQVKAALDAATADASAAAKPPESASS